MYHIFFIYLSAHGHLDSFPLWATVNNDAVKVGVQLFLHILFSILLYMRVCVFHMNINPLTDI